jgi:UDP-N-acetyl-D-mannosaminuronate dehydrogenase
VVGIRTRWVAMGDRRTKVDLLNAARPYIRHINSDSIAPLRATGRLCATIDFPRIAESNAVIL